ncbi:mannose-1-phosphate guanylyltransferase [Novosphingobium fuchskuhlense]|uniref:Mannose-1-phosphate guanylyltransferase n=1 Tax=Novosphingobium fuchskuhlense TaxID=1117702 RepID=A0A117UTS6_9SPHN|nr:nucleotidyltransferase family protein [Novosphingobium fuchskuhlense]KUR70741.1 mannose-1-phosphate guanylyltransferase [Novosphingobium fuchskuhlense]
MNKLASDAAMVLAAGIGKRMRPLTATRPKPLVRVDGRPLIDHSLDKLVEAGVSRAVVNVHYLPGQIEAHLEQRSAPAIAISDEREALLETGGGMVKALPLIDADPFFCLNSDNVWLDGPQNVFAALSDAWDPAQMDALLLLVSHARAFNYNGRGDFHLDPLGRITRRKPGRVAPFIYTGIQIVSHRLLREAPKGAFSTGVLWDRAIDEGRLYGISHSGLWFEVGAPQMIAPTEAALQRG